ncbi:BREX-1 system adenine-specific DNA-methyltransferase PglX [Campylobacter sp. VBCF_06 NA8]|uniref:Eco57I restriction-modification methylase domain-containing protein n=1 Tax=Campylobacter sp. VBCF_06 NA8 TaxID=2983822 RepID=UPI0022E9E3E8|nr:N-6 DNA methylase [Campylobacter sp. VBCF_06 NA8]MDA3046457.1 BREX-1 system adenine-specific DNA-methyltransferase PglX [Campylobacter sp. VBCF_06 NA8]
MALFKEKIIKEQKQDEKTLNERYENLLKFQAKIDAIKGYKEEEYQTDFLHDIFEACLGYTLKTTNPQNFNLARESKNETDAKKADGAILGANSEVIGVIELKDQKTHDLDKIENQAFNYHNSNSKSRYIIISNFDEIRLYIDKKTAYEKFSLFTMTRDEFELFHQIFCFENINSFKTIDLRDKSENSDREISKRLYADFSEFRLKLFENAVQENPQISPKEILSLVQKLCDRIIFVLFAEDYGLLRSNFVADIHEQWQNQKFTDFNLYEIWQIYFDAIDKGNDKLGVLAYNGGLFATDEALNSLRLSDEILQSYIAKLSSYDFASDIGVNILGHIFEQSLSDLEELTAQVENKNFDKKDSKRKKDGIFYTPEYIVKFIISQTLGEICENEKSRLNLHEISLPKNPKRLSKAETQTLENIRAYKDFLLNLKIIDPACGSGAFLNGALDFLINEHKNLDKFRKIYENEALPLYDIEPQILENNLFGVDINADAVQIAKLSLWLRTAQKGRKLTNLSNNIKCANSLLDFPFNFKFDCVIGNPPYVNAKNMNKNDRKEILYKFPLLTGSWDLYLPFLIKGYEILKENGAYGWIIPNKLLIADYAKPTLEFLKSNSLKSVVIFHKDLLIFEDVGVASIITIGNKNSAITNQKYYELNNINDLENLSKFEKKENPFNRFKKLKDFGILINSGTTGFEAQKIIPLLNENSDGIKFIVSGTIDPYIILNQKIPYMKKIYTNPYIKFDENIIAKSKFEFWNKPKIAIAGLSKRIEAVYSDKPLALGVGCYGIYDFKNFNPKFLLAILNSKFITCYLNIEFKDKYLASGSLAIQKSTIEQLPLVFTDNQQPFIDLADKLIELNSNLQTTKTEFLRELNLEKIPQKLAEFENLEFDEFIKEYTKAKKEKFADKLAEVKFKNYYESFFSEYKSRVLSLKSQILRSENELNSLVFALYDLSADEIALIENA